MASIQQIYGGTLTVSTTELSVVTGTSTLGASSTAAHAEAVVDLSALAAGDSVRLRVRKSVLSGGTARIAQDTTYTGPLAAPLLQIPLGMCLAGWDVTLVKVAGGDRAIPAAIYAVA